MNLLLLNTPAAGGKLEQALEKLIDFGMDAGKDILIAILIYVIGRFIIRQISVLVARILEKRKIETSVQTFLKSLIKILLNMILAFAIIGKLGVETTSFAALLASAGVAVGMALSGNLSNFAGGLIILIFKPFKVGDYIDGPGVSGTIKEIQIFHTILSTLDNRMIYVPNGSLSGNAVTNYSKQDKRRVEWVFGVEYGEDVKRVRAVLQRIINADSRILGLSSFLAGIIFYTREVLLTSHYEKRLFEHASQPRVACADIRLLSYLWSRTNLSRDSYQSG